MKTETPKNPPRPVLIRANYDAPSRVFRAEIFALGDDGNVAPEPLITAQSPTSELMAINAAMKGFADIHGGAEPPEPPVLPKAGIVRLLRDFAMLVDFTGNKVASAVLLAAFYEKAKNQPLSANEEWTDDGRKKAKAWTNAVIENNAAGMGFGEAIRKADADAPLRVREW